MLFAILASMGFAQECRVNGCAEALFVDAHTQQCCTDADEAWVCLKYAGGAEIRCGQGHPQQTWCVPVGPGGWDGVVRWCNSGGASGFGDAYKPFAAASASEAVSKAQAGSGALSAEGSFFAQGWLHDWKAAGIVAVAISLALVALGYIFGFALNSREIKMWAGMELVQAFGSVLLLASLIGLLAFFDIVAQEVAEATMQTINYGSACTENMGKPCAMHVADIYISSLVDAASESASSMLENAMRTAQSASRRGGVQAYTFYALWAGGSWGPNAGMTMLVDKYNMLFDYYAKILASLQAQKYFIDVITYGIAPVFLLVGIVLRTFYFSRKLGGLLLAIAVALMLIYPLTYIFSWLTLTVAVYGDNMFAASDTCPAECKIATPAATYVAGDGTKFDIRSADDVQAGVNIGAIGLSEGRVTQIVHKEGGGYEFPAGDAATFVACTELADQGLTNVPNSCSNCPSICREVPYPAYSQICMQERIEAACRQCNINCKVVRLHSTCSDPNAGDYCEELAYNNQRGAYEADAACRISQPMEQVEIQSNVPVYPDADEAIEGVCSSCEGCPAFCRVRIDDNGAIGLRTDIAACNSNIACQRCAGIGAYSNEPQAAGLCMMTLKKDSTQTCDELCTQQCPAYCRVQVNGQKSYPQGCTAQACSSCPIGCYVSPPVNALCAAPPDGHEDENCKSCPSVCRYSDYSVTIDSNNLKDDAGTQDVNEGVCGNLLAEDGSGVCNDASCAAQCKNFALQYSAANVPRICRDFKPAGAAYACEGCTPECRVKLTYTNAQNNQLLYQDKTALCRNPANPNQPGQLCADANCVAPCTKTAALPNGGSCLPYNADAADAVSCKKCPYECRVLENGQVPAYCNTVAMQGACLFSDGSRNCANECKVEVGTGANKPPVCMPYIGNGAGNDPSEIPIVQRQAPYNDRTECRQCPEECRLQGDAACNLDGDYFDCSAQSCADECRVNAPPINNACREVEQKYCKNCPLECRLDNVDIPDRAERCAGCADCVSECRAEVPFGVCDKYVPCSQECLGEPKVRTDCADRCLEEELSGTSKITPASFITKIGGAEGDSLTKNVGIFMLPAIVLPLFSIVLILSFIRVLSPILGGEIEIPAIARLI